MTTVVTVWRKLRCLLDKSFIYRKVLYTSPHTELSNPILSHGATSFNDALFYLSCILCFEGLENVHPKVKRKVLIISGNERKCFIVENFVCGSAPHDASDGFNCSNYEKGKKLEIAQITAFSCQSAGHLLTGKNTANNCVGACSCRGR